MRDAAPFRPFDIHLADGRAIAVENHDFIMLSPTGRTAIVYQRDGLFDIIDLMMVTSLKPNSQMVTGRGNNRFLALEGPAGFSG